MADNKKEPFHWNFDLKNTDSDFTDIEYSPEVVSPAEGQDDLKPFIFVDGKYNPETDADAWSANDAETDNEKKKRRNEEEDDLYASGKKNSVGKLSAADFFKNKRIPWVPILIAAGVLIAVILAIILWPKKKEEAAWALRDDPDISNLVNNYFEAIKTGDEQLMRNTLVSEAEIDSVELLLQSKVFEDFKNVKIYSYPGMAEDETCLFVLTDVKFTNISTAATKSYVLYSRPDTIVKKLRLMTEAELNAEKDKAYEEAKVSGQETKETAFVYYSNAFSDSEFMNGVREEADAKYMSQLSSDSVLAYYVEKWKEGTYIVPTTAEGETGNTPVGPGSSEAVPSNTTDSSDVTTPVTTVSGETLMEAKSAFINDNDVRVRSTPNTESSDNILGKLHFAHRILIVGETDEWYHIRDVLTEDGAGGEQTPTGWEGYVFKEFVVEYFSQLQQP
ncbi:MAG: SH3 domain-containing protein [Lachnospiraceae bacterium]|nr:SH3 domain-containing protein [Lachnospiraceae bacterium]